MNYLYGPPVLPLSNDTSILTVILGRRAPSVNSLARFNLLAPQLQPVKLSFSDLAHPSTSLPGTLGAIKLPRFNTRQNKIVESLSINPMDLKLRLTSREDEIRRVLNTFDRDKIEGRVYRKKDMGSLVRVLGLKNTIHRDALYTAVDEAYRTYLPQ